MLVDQLISYLVGIKQTNGNIPVLLADSYDHYEIKWIDHSEKREAMREHVCIRIDDNTSRVKHGDEK